MYVSKLSKILMPSDLTSYYLVTITGMCVSEKSTDFCKVLPFIILEVVVLIFHRFT